MYSIKHSKMAWLILAILCSTPLIIKTEPAYACSCARPDPVHESVAQATAVFAGRVINIEPIDHRRIEVDFDVETVWKGAATSTIRIYTAPNSAMCGYLFEEGRSYLVYAHQRQETLQVSQCSRTNLLSQSDEDLAILNQQDRPTRSTPEQFGFQKWLSCDR